MKNLGKSGQILGNLGNLWTSGKPVETLGTVGKHVDFFWNFGESGNGCTLGKTWEIFGNLGNLGNLEKSVKICEILEIREI